MNTHSIALSRSVATVALGLCQATFSFSDHGDQAAAPRSDSHAPIGVMGDHLHSKGEFMLSYRHMEMSMDGHRSKGDKLTSHEVFQLGFDAAATEMDMSMDMFGIMYAPNDRITFMGMANYLDLKMEMEMNPHADMMGHGGHGMGAMSHATSGWGDIGVTALVRGWEKNNHRMHWNLGFTAPTGAVDEMMHGAFQPYGMQLGSGTWDAKIGATYTGSSERNAWGAQVLGTIRLEDVGESGFGRSDVFETSIWGSWLATSSVSLSARLKFQAEGSLVGHYNGAHNHSAPPHFQGNYGGEVLEALFGINYLFVDGALKGNRVALEVGAPVYQHLNGVGMNRDTMGTLGWQLAW